MKSGFDKKRVQKKLLFNAACSADVKGIAFQFTYVARMKIHMFKILLAMKGAFSPD
jgi:hypothetical protein